MARPYLGLKFQSPVHGEYPTWRIVAQVDVWRWTAEIVDADNPALLGRRSEFTIEAIDSLAASTAAAAVVTRETDEWYRLAPDGAVVHYHHAFGAYIRCVVVLDAGVRQLKPIALVGDWSEHDLASTFRRIFDGWPLAPFRPHPTLLYEHPEFAGVARRRTANPADMEPIPPPGRIRPQVIRVPADALVVMVGPSGSGKSTIAETNFGPYQIVSSDHLRAVVSDDQADMSATAAAFHLLDEIVRFRVQRRLLTVVDATNLLAIDRQRWVTEGRAARVPVVGIVVNPGLDACLHRNGQRDRKVPASVIRRQHRMIDKTTSWDEFDTVWPITDGCPVRVVVIEEESHERAS